MAKKVLIVEDEPGYQELLAFLLKGYDVELVASAEAAVEKLERERFELIVSDVQLLGASGLCLLDALKERNQKIPIVFCTVYADPEIRDRALADGAAGYLNKPFDQKIFAGLVRTALHGDPQGPPPPAMAATA